MAQANLTVANAAASVVRTGFNAAIAAAASSSSGPTEPPEVLAGMIWQDTSVTPPLMKQRNAADTAWLLCAGSKPNIGGTENAITLSLGAGTTAIPDGFALIFTATEENTGTTTINGQAATTLSGDPLPAGYISTQAPTQAIWDGPNSRWVVLPASLAPPELTLGQATDPDSTVFGTVNGKILDDQTRAALNAEGDAPLYAGRTWVNFDGTTTPLTIRGSGNVSSVVRNGAGNYTVNLIEQMPDANYAVSISVRLEGQNRSPHHESVSAGSFVIRIRTGAGSNEDNPEVHASIIR